MNTEQLYQERLNRYVTAMRNEKPDRVPIRPFVAEFTAPTLHLACLGPSWIDPQFRRF